MQTNALVTGLRQVARSAARNSPTILTALGVTGLIGTVILAVEATPKAMNVIFEEQRFRYEEGEAAHTDDAVDPKDIIALTWKFYIPTAVMGATTVACIIGANHISLRRNAALASLFTMTESALKQYQAKVVEQLGPAKEEKIRGEISQEKLNKNPTDESTVVSTGKGSYLCYDTFSGRYFRTNIDDIGSAEIRFNRRLMQEGWLDINEFYDELGLDSIDMGNEMGWIADHGVMEINSTTKIAASGEPCLVIDYYVSPKHI